MKIDFYKYLHTNKFITHALLMALGEGEQATKLIGSFPVQEDGEEKGKILPVDVKLTFNGVEVNFIDFYEFMESEYYNEVEQVAKEFFKTKVSEKMNKIYDLFNSMESYVDELTEQIDWNYKPNKEKIKN